VKIVVQPTVFTHIPEEPEEPEEEG